MNQNRLKYAVVCGVLLVVVAVLVLHLLARRGPALHKNILACAHELQMLGVEAKSFAASHDGRYPDTLGALAKEAGDVQMFASPFFVSPPGMLDDADAWSDYRLISNCSTGDAPKKVFMFYEGSFQGKTIRVDLHVDGSVCPYVNGAKYLR